MKWTTTKPSVEGWYWLRRLGSTKAVEIIADGDNPTYWVVVGAELRWSLGGMDGEWLGPITPTDDAALRRAKGEGKLEGMEEAAILVEAMPMATPYNTALSLRWVVKERREADARAAQIEEGE